MEDRYKALQVLLSGGPGHGSVGWSELVEAVREVNRAAEEEEEEEARKLLERLISHQGWVPAPPVLPHAMPPLELLKVMVLEELHPRLLEEERLREAVRSAADEARSPALRSLARSLLERGRGEG